MLTWQKYHGIKDETRRANLAGFRIGQGPLAGLDRFGKKILLPNPSPVKSPGHGQSRRQVNDLFGVDAQETEKSKIRATMTTCDPVPWHRRLSAWSSNTGDWPVLYFEASLCCLRGKDEYPGTARMFSHDRSLDSGHGGKVGRLCLKKENDMIRIRKTSAGERYKVESRVNGVRKYYYARTYKEAQDKEAEFEAMRMPKVDLTLVDIVDAFLRRSWYV